ncbi:DUF6283 family protein [Streptomyces sp. NPDC058861]|uniref:DUF6283 family protein n=1 Tax=Streptomyces sp. NPDC058861 TaxID=3346653 RepID=UPI003694A974
MFSDAQVEEVLRQLAEANAAALDPDRPAAAREAGSVPGPRVARVVRKRPGDDEWQVESRVYRGTAAVQPRPCAGEKGCPWRRDAPAGQFPPTVFEHSAAGNRTSGPPTRKPLPPGPTPPLCGAGRPPARRRCPTAPPARPPPTEVDTPRRTNP